ncbi:MAG: helix-turn-helix domain-containing protein [Eubacteriales bacterium]
MNASCTLSNLIVTAVYAFNRIHTAAGTSCERKDREHCAIALKVEGQTVYTNEGKRVCSDSTHAVFLPQGANYRWTCREKGLCLIAEFDCLPPFPKEIVSFHVKNISELAGVFTKLENIMTFRKGAYPAKCMAGLYEILAKLAESDPADYRLSSKGGRIRRSVEYLESHFADETLSNPMLAALSGVSTVYFRKIFTELYGVPPMQYVSRIRIEKAKGLLISDYGSVTQIAEATGFGSVYHFCKAFKKATGLTPGEWRTKSRF